MGEELTLRERLEKETEKGFTLATSQITSVMGTELYQFTSIVSNLATSILSGITNSFTSLLSLFSVKSNQTLQTENKQLSMMEEQNTLLRSLLKYFRLEQKEENRFIKDDEEKKGFLG
jgi:hypothetical protein